MAEKNITSLEQLKKLALRGRTYSAAHISKLAELVAAGLEDARHTAITVTLPAAGWDGGVQCVKHESLLADENYWYFVCGDADVKADDITVNGEATFRCEATPDADLTVDILRLEVEA